MKPVLPRRAVLAGLLAGAAAPAFAGAPLTSLRPRLRGEAAPRPVAPAAESLIRAAGLGGKVTYVVANARTGEVLEIRKPLMRMPPASVTKAMTALYALEALGPEHRFETQVLATGDVSGGRLDGDLVLVGSGDPTLDTDALGDLAAGLKSAGIYEVTGGLKIWANALPELPWIDPDQPDHVGYNPAISGLNLNYNRVHFEWKRGSSGYDVTLQARARKFRPEVSVARMRIEDRRFPVYTYEDRRGIDNWTVAKGALGREGARWLPVRHPPEYVADVFETLARSHGIVVKRAERVKNRVDGRLLAKVESAPLKDVLQGMLRYSTNLTAEATGMAATRVRGHDFFDLAGSATAMNGWLNAQLGCRSAAFVDHSGLGYGSRISASDMVRGLVAAHRRGDLQPILKEFKLGEVSKAAAKTHVRAKTGTLNFVSALAGYVSTPNDTELAFAIFTADTARRDAIKVEERERPAGARGWSRRSRTLQKKTDRGLGR